ncbi:MAG: aminoacyl-histidine dipeptidase [Lachnospiraceae bacterium]|nr:aminoacyl-histidine dipeptidase [Lachnospiraceae bacterium]
MRTDVYMNYLDYFKKICSIPHGSGNVQAISDYLVSFANEHNLECHRDEALNVIIIKEASKGREGDEPVIIQGHMDMVAVSDDGRDMTKVPLELKEDGDFLYADKTSLGGDDGIAVAYGLTLLSDETLSLPRIELVVTTDEEVGMIGATALDTSVLKGKRMINIDSEEEGIFLVSCAGGARIDISFPLTETSPEGGEAYEINVEGLLGGHSGTEINKGRANAIRLMGRILKKLADAKLLLAINDIKGGTADNAIALGCTATVLCKPIESELFEIIKYEVMEKYLKIETTAEITLKKAEACANSGKWFYNPEATLSGLLTTLPNGVIAMSKDIEGLVETSLNAGIIRMDEKGVNISISVRSSIDEEKKNLVNHVLEIAANHGASTNVHGDYPGWAYRENSPLRDRMVEVYTEMFGSRPEIRALHAGLECGVFAGKIRDLDCISFGPNLYDIHTTGERMSLSSAKRMWDYLVKVLEK